MIYSILRTDLSWIGFFGGRDASGRLFSDAKISIRMKALADYIHSKGLKAGIYTVVGTNTCGSIYDKDPNLL